MRRLVYWISLHLRVLLKCYCFFIDRHKEADPGIYFIMYHSIDEKISLELDIDLSMFINQINWLTTIGEIISISDAETKLMNSELLEKKYFVITFDDGYSNFFNSVYPFFKKNNIPALLYVNTEFIENESLTPINRKVGFTGKLSSMSWEQLRVLNDDPLMTIGGHCHEHVELTSLSNLQIHQNLVTSIKLLEEKLSFTPSHFCYPRGIYETRVINEVKRLFHSAVTTECPGEPVKAIGDNYQIPRIPALRSDKLFWFKCRVLGKLQSDLKILKYISDRYVK
jgi:peptidoglycan/xylan/chitin deacetylase (PgdA/CDA1 family)